MSTFLASLRRATGLVAAICVVSSAAGADGQSTPIGGFVPLVGIGLTDKFEEGDIFGSATFFIAQAEDEYDGTPLSGSGPSPYYDLAILDTGAAAHILTSQASGPTGFDIVGNDFDGTNTQDIGGATGLITLSINDPLALFAAGLADKVGTGSPLVMNTSAMRGQSSVATLSAPSAWKLPNIVGLPMAAQHAIAIRNSEPQIFQQGLRTVRAPNVDFIDLGTGASQGIVRRIDLNLRPGSGFIAGPLYVQNLTFDLETPPHEDPLSPTVVENAGLFLDVDMADDGGSFQDKEFLFDTGADVTVISQRTARRLGIDAVLDPADFHAEVEGSGGVSGELPGFYIDSLSLLTSGGTFDLTHVPVIVADLPNPNDIGNVLDGVIGMNLFVGRDLVIDAKPQIGQGGAGPSLYIGDPVYATHTWASTGPTNEWNALDAWTGGGPPTAMWDAQARNTTGSAKTAIVAANSTVYRMTVASDTAAAMKVSISAGATLRTFGETLIEAGGTVQLQGGKIDSQSIIVDGGTLAGGGQVFVGTGPLNGAVRNLSGRVEPGGVAGGLVGTLAITGDLASLDAGTLAFDIGGLAAGTQYDQITLSRFAFLGGTLQVTLANLGGGTFAPAVGAMFTLINAGEAVNGQFDNLVLPAGYQWMVDYQAKAVVLKVTGLGSTPGDFDSSGSVNAADLVALKNGFGTLYDGADALKWQRNLHITGAVAVPEPGAATTLLAIVIGGLLNRRSLAV